MTSAPQLVSADHGALWTPARELTAEDRANHRHTIKIMREAVQKVGAAGLAATQLGISLRLFVTNGQGALPAVAINPTWRAVGSAFISKPERCLSRMDYSTYVRRPAKIEATWEDEAGVRATRLLESMEARIFLHCWDLIDGTPIFPRPVARVPVTA